MKLGISFDILSDLQVKIKWFWYVYSMTNYTILHELFYCKQESE